MAYIITSLGMQLADPATVQAFETVVVNSNFTTLENGILDDRGRLTTLEANQFPTTDLAFYDFFNSGKVGDNTTLKTRTIPAQGRAVTVIIQVTARHGFDTANRDGGITLSASAGTSLYTPDDNRTTALAQKYAAWAGTWFYNLSASQASTFTFKSSSNDTEFWRGEIATFIVPTSKVN